MRLSRRLTLGAMALALVVSACSSGGGSKPTIKIGSVSFDEAKIMAEIYGQALEAKGFTVDRSGFGLGDRPVVAPAIEKGTIDLQPEYIGSRLGYEKGTPTGDSNANFTALQPLLAAKNLTVLDYTPAIDTNAFVVRADTAAQFHLTKMSDLAAVQTQLKFGLATDCLTNMLCGAPGGALSQYGITPDTIAAGTLLAACSPAMAAALLAKTVDVGELCSTQPDIVVNGWTTLVDDLKTQPADNLAPIVRNDYLAKLSSADKDLFEQTLNSVDAQMDTTTLTTLVKDVDVDPQDLATVAKTWLQSKGFVPAGS
jgi:osmoprotectant transport system substrate-binding protein